MDSGLMPKWADKNFQIPDIAVSYWNIPEGKRTMKDLILYIRADEAGHVSYDQPSPFGGALRIACQAVSNSVRQPRCWTSNRADLCFASGE